MSHEEDNISFHVDLVTEVRTWGSTSVLLAPQCRDTNDDVFAFVQALIREYLSKKKLITTLAAYNNEQVGCVLHP